MKFIIQALVFCVILLGVTAAEIDKAEEIRLLNQDSGTVFTNLESNEQFMNFANKTSNYIFFLYDNNENSVAAFTQVLPIVKNLLLKKSLKESPSIGMIFVQPENPFLSKFKVTSLPAISMVRNEKIVNTIEFPILDDELEKQLFKYSFDTVIQISSSSEVWQLAKDGEVKVCVYVGEREEEREELRAKVNVRGKENEIGRRGNFYAAVNDTPKENPTIFAEWRDKANERSEYDSDEVAPEKKSRYFENMKAFLGEFGFTNVPIHEKRANLSLTSPQTDNSSPTSEKHTNDEQSENSSENEEDEDDEDDFFNEEDSKTEQEKSEAERLFEDVTENGFLFCTSSNILLGNFDYPTSGPTETKNERLAAGEGWDIDSIERFISIATIPIFEPAPEWCRATRFDIYLSDAYYNLAMDYSKNKSESFTHKHAAANTKTSASKEEKQVIELYSLAEKWRGEYAFSVYNYNDYADEAALIGCFKENCGVVNGEMIGQSHVVGNGLFETSQLDADLKQFSEGTLKLRRRSQPAIPPKDNIVHLTYDTFNATVSAHDVLVYFCDSDDCQTPPAEFAAAAERTHTRCVFATYDVTYNDLPEDSSDAYAGALVRYGSGKALMYNGPPERDAISAFAVDPSTPIPLSHDDDAEDVEDDEDDETGSNANERKSTADAGNSENDADDAADERSGTDGNDSDIRDNSKEEEIILDEDDINFYDEESTTADDDNDDTDIDDIDADLNADTTGDSEESSAEQKTSGEADDEEEEMVNLDHVKISVPDNTKKAVIDDEDDDEELGGTEVEFDEGLASEVKEQQGDTADARQRKETHENESGMKDSNVNGNKQEKSATNEPKQGHQDIKDEL